MTGRAAEVVEDNTPLDGSRIDVGARIGWLLRTTRLHAGVRLRDMAGLLSEVGVKVSTTTLSRCEAGQLRAGAVLDGYETVLGVPVGRLRSTVDAVCRKFAYSPVDTDPHLPPADLTMFSRAVDAVRADHPKAGDWLLFAREHEDHRNFGLDHDSMYPLVNRLVTELNRGVGIAYLPRYDALSRLLASEYGVVVEEVVRDQVEAPGTQAVIDMMVVLGERPTAERLKWMVSLLAHPSIRIMFGAELAIENMRSAGGLTDEDWVQIAPTFAEIYDATEDLERRTALTRLFKNMPPRTRYEIHGIIRTLLQYTSGPSDWRLEPDNVHLTITGAVSRMACMELGHPYQPMLTRILFELLYDFRGPRSGAAVLLLMGSVYDEVVHPHLVELAMSGPDYPTREGARGMLHVVQPANAVPDVREWLSSDDQDAVDTACLALATAGIPIPTNVLEPVLGVPGGQYLAPFRAAGLVKHPRIAEVAVDQSLPEDMRLAAAWWLTSERVAQ